MSDQETEMPVEVDVIQPIFEGECPSLSGRSTLTYEIGRHEKDASLHLRIVGNGGGGMWCRDWSAASQIEAIVKGDAELTAKSFHILTPGRSINTGGFYAAVLKDLGLIRAIAENTRLHEHVPATSFDKVVKARMASPVPPESKVVRRKGKEG